MLTNHKRRYPSDEEEMEEEIRPRKKRKLSTVPLSNSSFKSLSKEDRVQWGSKKPLENVGMTVGDWNLIRNFYNAVMVDLQSFNDLPHRYQHSADVARILRFLQMNKSLAEYRRSLETVLHDLTMEHYFRDSSNDGTFVGELMKTLTKRWKV